MNLFDTLTPPAPAPTTVERCPDGNVLAAFWIEAGSWVRGCRDCGHHVPHP